MAGRNVLLQSTNLLSYNLAQSIYYRSTTSEQANMVAAAGIRNRHVVFLLSSIFLSSLE